MFHSLLLFCLWLLVMPYPLSTASAVRYEAHLKLISIPLFVVFVLQTLLRRCTGSSLFASCFCPVTCLELARVSVRLSLSCVVRILLVPWRLLGCRLVFAACSGANTSHGNHMASRLCSTLSAHQIQCAILTKRPSSPARISSFPCQRTLFSWIQHSWSSR